MQVTRRNFLGSIGMLVCPALYPRFTNNHIIKGLDDDPSLNQHAYLNLLRDSANLNEEIAEKNLRQLRNLLEPVIRERVLRGVRLPEYRLAPMLHNNRYVRQLQEGQHKWWVYTGLEVDIGAETFISRKYASDSRWDILGRKLDTMVAQWIKRIKEHQFIQRHQQYKIYISDMQFWHSTGHCNIYSHDGRQIGARIDPNLSFYGWVTLQIWRKR